MRVWIVFGLVLAVVACAAPKSGMPDTEVGLSKVGIAEISSPPEVTENAVDPGESAVLPRVFDESPPVVSHGVADFLPITRDENLCLDCHQTDEAGEGLPTPVPASHYTDYRNAPSAAGDDVVGARYECTLCHVPTTDAAPLVDNRFGG